MKQSLFKDFARYAGLNILGMLGLSGYILADTFFVSKALGATGLAGLNLSIPIYSVIHALGLMIGIGAATRFSILKSRKQSREAESILATAWKVGVLVGFILTVIGLGASSSLALLLGADSTTLPLTTIYLRLILLFSPCFITNNVMLAFVRNDGNPNLAMVAMLTGSFSNIILDYLFMFPLGMGMFGAAFATCLAPIISLAVLSWHFVGKKSILRNLVKGKLMWRALPDLFALGISAFVMEVASAVVLITFNLVILSLEGNLGVAAYGIVANLALVGVGIFTGLAQGTQPLASKYYGENDDVRQSKIRQYAFITALGIAMVLYLGITIYSEGIVAVFNSEGNLQVAQLADKGLRIYFLGFFFMGLNIVAATVFSATENAKDAFAISILRGLVLIVPLVFFLSKLWQMTGVWLAFVLTEMIVTFLGVYLERIKSAGLSLVGASPR